LIHKEYKKLFLNTSIFHIRTENHMHNSYLHLLQSPFYCFTFFKSQPETSDTLSHQSVVSSFQRIFLSFTFNLPFCFCK